MRYGIIAVSTLEAEGLSPRGRKRRAKSGETVITEQEVRNIAKASGETLDEACSRLGTRLTGLTDIEYTQAKQGGWNYE